MKIAWCQNVFITFLLTLGLSGCNSAPFSTFPTIIAQSSITATAPANSHLGKRNLKAKTANKQTTTNKLLPLILDASEKPDTNNLWTHMAQEFQIPFAEDHPAVKAQIEWFRQHQDYLQRTTKRAEPYMYLVYEQVQQRNLPAEVVLLPIIESAYYPLAYSGAGAAGLWQLMPGTASKFGLKRNGWYDGRRDIFASTTAALDYLNYLQNFFNGNWLLALAAYDAGEGTVQAAIKRNELAGKDTDFWSLKLPQETMTYVPRMLALAALIKHPDIYQIPLPAIDNHPYLGKVVVGSQIKLVDAAKLAGISLQELKQLNPGYSRWSTVPNGPSHLLLPLSKIDNFKENLAQLPRVRQTSWGKYKVQRGDTLAKIAKRYNTTAILIQRANHLKNDRGLVRGKIIIVPAISHAIASGEVKLPAKHTATVLANNAVEQIDTNEIHNTDGENDEISNNETNLEPAAIPTIRRHTIKAGETLSHIAKRYQISIKQLVIANKLSAKKVLKPGRKLIIPKSSFSAVTKKRTPSQARHYKVRNGDNLSKIAHRLHVSIPTLKKLNHLNSNALKPGMVLQLPAV